MPWFFLNKLLITMNPSDFVPLHLQRHKHQHRQNHEEAKAAEEQCIGFHLEQYVHENIERKQQRSHHQRGLADFQDARQVARDQHDGHQHGDKVRPEEGDVLAEREQQRVEHQQRGTDEQILYRMDGRLPAVLHEENRGEGEENEQVGVLHRARGLLVL